MPSSTLALPATSIASTTKSASIRAWDIIHRSSSNAWHMPSKVSTKSDEDHAREAAHFDQSLQPRGWARTLDSTMDFDRKGEYEEFRAFLDRGPAESMCSWLESEGVPSCVEARALSSGIES